MPGAIFYAVHRIEEASVLAAWEGEWRKAQPTWSATFSRARSVAIDLDPLSLLCRLAASVPPPRMHTVRFAGVLSAAHKWRSRVVPPVSPTEVADDEPAHAHQPQRPATHRCHYWPWARLLKRSLGVDGEKCEACSARMKLHALVIAARSIERLLAHLGEPTEPPPLSPARGQPFFKSRAVRRKMADLHAPPGQVEMFGA